MAQERRRVDNRLPLANGIDTRAEWRNCGLYALYFLVLLFLPLGAAAGYMTRQHRPAGTILLSAMYLIFALIGLWVVTRVRRLLRGELLGPRIWWAGFDLFLCGVFYDSLAHAWWKGPLPTFDQLLPNGSADFVRQAVYVIGMAWVFAGLIIPILRDARRRRLSAPSPAVQ